MNESHKPCSDAGANRRDEEVSGMSVHPMTDYEKGFRYGRQVAGRMSTAERRRRNDRDVSESEYVRRGSPTRGFWLGFRRAMRDDS